MSTSDAEPPADEADGAPGPDRTPHEEPDKLSADAELVISLTLSPQRTASLPTRFSYRVDDPYAVRLRFCLETQGPVEWVFARALLAAGMYDPVGAGDVRIWPGDNRALVCMYLASPYGCAHLEIPAAPLTRWLLSIYRLVPLGQENRHLDFDALVERLLREP